MHPLKPHHLGHSSPTLLQVDTAGSVIRSQASDRAPYIAYTVFGFSAASLTAQAYTGMRHELHLGGYLLGQGYRLYLPTLQRFNRPDLYSPFAKGGHNAYAYCGADPVNATDPSGHFINRIIRLFSNTEKMNYKILKNSTDLQQFTTIGNKLQRSGIAVTEGHVLEAQTRFKNRPFTPLRLDHDAGVFRAEFAGSNLSGEAFMAIHSQSVYRANILRRNAKIERLGGRATTVPVLYTPPTSPTPSTRTLGTDGLPAYDDLGPPTYQDLFPPSYADATKPT